MEKNLRLLCGAQAFGFGPCSKLVTIANHLIKQGTEIDFYGFGVNLQYALSNMKIRKNIIDLKEANNFDYDAILTVMDPELAAWGYFYNIPVIAVDSLYWFWEWPQKEKETIRKSIQSIKDSSNYDQFTSYINSLPDHLKQYALHFMANVSYIQKYPGSERSLEEDGFNTIEVEPIVDMSYQKEVERDTVLVSFSGMVNPLVSEKDLTTYMKLCSLLLQNSLDKLKKDFNIIYTVNSSVLKEANSILSDQVESLTHQEFLQQLNQSVVMLAPAGITTIYECFAYQTPILFLPEQHDGHFKNYLSLSQTRKDLSQFRSIFPESLLNFRHDLIHNTDPLSYTRNLYDFYEHLLQGNYPEIFSSMKKDIEETLTRKENHRLYSKLKNQQKVFSNSLSENGSSIFDEMKQDLFKVLNQTK